LPSKLAAIIFIIAYILAFSIVGIIGLAVVLLFYNRYFQRISWKMILISLLMGVGIIVGLNYLSAGKLVQKIATIRMLLPGEKEEATENSYSSLALAIHMKVTLASLAKEPLLGCGIGGHAQAFDLNAPAWIFTNPDLSIANRENAGSLSLLLLSEMGILGFLTFAYAFGLILWRAWRAVVAARDNPVTWKILPICVGLLLGGIAEVALYFLRMPMYYFISLWFLLALISVIPDIINQVISASHKQKD
jgi:O-antigen ligase